MALVASFEDVKHCQFRRQSLVTPFMQASGNALTLFQKSGDTRDLVAFLRESEPDMVTRPHFHTVDQFQVMVDGDGVLGRHAIAPYCVHFARAYTPYGPLIGGSEKGVTFFTLRSRADPGANYLPESAGALKAITTRQPWQITRHFRFPYQTGAALSGPVELQAVPDMSDDRGLAAYTLSMAPNGETRAPDPSSSDGQYVIVVKGSLCHEGREHRAYTVVFVAAGDGSLAMRAGAEGLAAIILNFPRHTSITAVTHATSRSKKWQCELCAFSYDEAMGLPDDGLAPGTPWADIPEDWTCPDCGAGKGDFKPSAFIDPVKS